MKVFFIAALFHLKVKGDLGRGIRLWGDTFLTNNPRSTISPLLSQYFRESVGHIEINALENATAVVYQLQEIKEPLDTELQAITYLDRLMALISFFLNSMWLVKDNSVNTELGFLVYPYKEVQTNVFTNSRAVYFSNAAGVCADTTFSDEEMRLAREFFNMYDSSNFENVNTGRIPHTPQDSKRLERVFYFLQAARAASDLSIRISHYMTCFEALFCTDSAELSHKLAERTALFLGGEPNDKLKVYQTLKAAYTIRSKTVHGDRLSFRLINDLPRIVCACDTFLRLILTSILKSEEHIQLFLSTTDKIEQFMVELLFGVHAMEIEGR